MLTLEVEFLTGVYRAALPDGSDGEWPPHPERLFSALVQAWGDGGRQANERAALEWLEALPPPSIQASETAYAPRRDAPIVYVPPNDQKGSDPAVLPELRRRQARTFRAVVPGEASVRFQWRASPGADFERAIDALASRIASLGHSASLVRCARVSAPSLEDPLWVPREDGTIGLRSTYPGRLADLEHWFGTEGGKLRERPRSKRVVFYGLRVEAHEPPKSIFGGPSDWFVFEDEGGFRPDLLAWGRVAKKLRDALMSLSRQPPPEVLSGHDGDGNPTRRPHVAFVPMANVGSRHASGDLLGFAVVVPRGLAGQEREEVLSALARFARLENEEGSAAELRLTDNHRWFVSRAPSPSRFSLKPGRYCVTARSWASVTPLFLDRFPDEDDPVEAASIVAAACRNIGLPEPSEIEFHKHSPFRGAPSAYGRPGKHDDWNLPQRARFAERPRRHVVLRFEQPVRGPVILGAGRFYGFGLCLPMRGATEE